MILHPVHWPWLMELDHVQTFLLLHPTTTQAMYAVVSLDTLSLEQTVWILTNVLLMMETVIILPVPV